MKTTPSEPQMSSTELETNLLANANQLRTALAHDLKAEAHHIADPTQCGVIVRRHFDGLMVALYALIFLFLTAVLSALYLYTRHH